MLVTALFDRHTSSQSLCFAMYNVHYVAHIGEEKARMRIIHG